MARARSRYARYSGDQITHEWRWPAHLKQATGDKSLIATKSRQWDFPGRGRPQQDLHCELARCYLKPPTIGGRGVCGDHGVFITRDGEVRPNKHTVAEYPPKRNASTEATPDSTTLRYNDMPSRDDMWASITMVRSAKRGGRFLQGNSTRLILACLVCQMPIVCAGACDAAIPPMYLFVKSRLAIRTAEM